MPEVFTEKFYRDILDEIKNGVWVSDKNDVICYANKGMGVIAGIPAKKIEGANVLNDFSEDILKYFSPQYKRAREILKPVQYDDMPVVTPVGRESFQSGWLIPQVRGKNFNGMICTVEDVTQKIKSVSELKDKINEIERINKIMIGRELKMVKLKKENQYLRNKLGKNK